eukprot:10991455-Karenia_brevis.AAC.1
MLLHVFHSPTRSQLESFHNGTLQLATKKFRGLGVVRSRAELSRFSLEVKQVFEGVTRCAGQPPPRRDSVYGCPAGHPRASGHPFCCARPGKQIWCRPCNRAIAGSAW